MKIALCAIAKWENDYIKEWVKHYLGIGFDEIFVYDNNDESDPSVIAPIEDFVAEGKVHVIPWRGIDSVQIAAYNNFIERFGKRFDWTAFFDIDEFLILKKNSSIKEIFSRDEINAYDAVKVHWIIYGDNGVVERDMTRGVVESFMFDGNKRGWDVQSKSFINMMRVTHIPSCHGIYSANQCNIDLTPNGTPAGMPPNRSNNYAGMDTAYLAHFRTKTAKEYVKTIQRGHPIGSEYRKKEVYKHSVEYFFRLNERTKEKEGVFKKAGLV